MFALLTKVAPAFPNKVCAAFHVRWRIASQNKCTLPEIALAFAGRRHKMTEAAPNAAGSVDDGNLDFFEVQARGIGATPKVSAIRLISFIVSIHNPAFTKTFQRVEILACVFPEGNNGLIPAVNSCCHSLRTFTASPGSLGTSVSKR